MGAVIPSLRKGTFFCRRALSKISTFTKRVWIKGFFHCHLHGRNVGKKHHPAFDTVFPFLSPFLNSVTGFGDSSALGTVHSLYISIFNERVCNTFLCDNVIDEVALLNENIRRLENLTKNLIQHFDKINLNPLKLQLSDQMEWHVSLFAILHFLDEFPDEHVN